MLVFIYDIKHVKASKVGSLSLTFYFTYSDSTTSARVLTNFRTQYSGRLVYLLAFVLRIQEVPASNLALKMTIPTEGLYDFTHLSGTRDSVLNL
jgi:hypothetical protein